MKTKITVKIYKPIIFFVIFLFVAIIAKLTYVSLSTKVDDINLHEFAENRNTKSEVIYAKRGNIYDKEGNNLASVVNSYKIIAYLKGAQKSRPNDYVTDIDSTAKMLNEYLDIDYNEAVQLLSKDAFQTEFGSKGKNISESLKNKIEALNMKGIGFEVSQKRTYSMGAFASYIIGYAKVQGEDDEGKIVGELGLESYYNKDLSGTDGKTTYQTDAYGYTLPSAEIITEDAIDGANIYTTIDSNIQLFAETLTSNLAKNYEMDWMIFSVMDAKTGAIVASSTVPNFDPNDLNTISSYMNPLVSYTYEPGSVMKTFSFASAIEEGVYDGNKTYQSGSVTIADAVIKDHNNGDGWGKITYDQGYIYSSNVAASKISQKLGVKKLTKYYKNLGFGKKTGIELANEVEGKVNFKYETELATAAFGQGITITPIQMLQALSTLTNDGTVLKPYIVDKIVDDNGKVIYEGKKEELGKVYSKETMDYMHNLMYRYVYDGISGQWKPTKTIMIGKTGTAQIAAPGGGYLKGPNNYVRSFAGIFPEEEPRYIVYIAVKQINTGATNIAKEVTKAVDDIVSYLGLENNTKEKENKIIKLDSYISNETKKVTEELKNKKLEVITLGTGKYVIDQYPAKDTKVFENSKVFLMTNNDEYTMQDLTGWGLNEVRTYGNMLGINLAISGYGYATAQSIPPNTKLNVGDTLTIIFENNKNIVKKEE